MNNVFAVAIILIAILLILLSPLQYYHEVEGKITPGLTNKERYDTGYKWGCSDARKGGYPYLEGHPTHTAIFMKGYNTGYIDCSPDSDFDFDTSPKQKQQKQGINWLEICNNPIVDFFISESCDSLTSSDGYTLTTEGQRVLKCIAGGGLLLAVDPTGTTLAAAQKFAPAVEC